MDEQRDLGDYRGFRLYLLADGPSVRGYAMRTLIHPDGSTSEDAFSLAGRDVATVEARLRNLVDRELGSPPPAAGRHGFVVRLVRTCAWCGRIEQGGQWVVQDADATQPAAVSHSICPECAERMLAKEDE
jgi:hypothetical protein